MVETIKTFRLVVEFTIEEEYYSVFKDFDDLDTLRVYAARMIRNDCARYKFQNGFAAIAKWLFAAESNGWRVGKPKSAEYTYLLGIEYSGGGDQLLNYYGRAGDGDWVIFIRDAGLYDDTDYAALSDIVYEAVIDG